MIAAGKLDQRISVSATYRTREQNFGETIEGQGIPVELWANVRQQGSSERQRNGMTGTDNSYAIRIRWRAGLGDAPFLDNTATIAYRGRTLAISSIIEAGQNNREWLDIIATEAK